MKSDINRRSFLKYTAASTAAFTIVPRLVLGGLNQIAPSNKITLAHIGCGTQGLREMLGLLAMPEVQIVSVCDPVKDGNNYVDWSKDGLRADIAKTLGKPSWRKGAPGIPGGREVAKEVVEIFYANQRAAASYKGCAVYTDFWELLDKDVDAGKVMTPDHLHATVAIAAMKKGRHVLMHKPLANRVREARLVIETARQTKVSTHFLPASAGEQVRLMADWIKQGAIGNLREVHNWSHRPVWPQYATIPTDQPPVPKDFDWDLWLGPSLARPYHPHYTHAVFRGWYEFGGGSIADMGHYSLWPVFREFDLDAPFAVESTPSHVCTLNDQVSTKIRNDYAFPYACTIRFKFAAKATRPALDLFWYDGGMKPPTPEELEAEDKELAGEGMMFVGDKGRILAGFLGENARILSGGKSQDAGRGQGLPAASAQERARARNSTWIEAFKGGKPTYGDFLLAGPISEAFNLGAISLRLGGKRLRWDAANMKITNLPEANKYLTREYRKGWELTG
ncbi:MAG: Gfo/Idh/MocA family oxidoreductase [Verrucomicrobia bacterium]|nr:Gfo/Idh/MocA family oxidoreductase [Verrucomicrobiota bacterium]